MCLGRIGKQIDQNVFVDCCFVVCLPSRPSMSEVPCRKRDDYLEWPEYFMAVAFLSAQRSKDPNSQVLPTLGIALDFAPSPIFLLLSASSEIQQNHNQQNLLYHQTFSLFFLSSYSNHDLVIPWGPTI